MLLSAAAALSAVVTDEQLNPSYVVPSVFDPKVPLAVAAAVAAAAKDDPAAATGPEPDDTNDR
jgi:malate dehydrogenase (oxaloacetate-decarboxylating)